MMVLTDASRHDWLDAFLRIDLTEGEECAIGHGFAIVRQKPGMPPGEGYLVPFCHEQHAAK
jgi:hypothetical protein